MSYEKGQEVGTETVTLLSLSEGLSSDYGAIRCQDQVETRFTVQRYNVRWSVHISVCMDDLGSVSRYYSCSHNIILGAHSPKIAYIVQDV